MPQCEMWTRSLCECWALLDMQIFYRLSLPSSCSAICKSELDLKWGSPKLVDLIKRNLLMMLFQARALPHACLCKAFLSV